MNTYTLITIGVLVAAVCLWLWFGYVYSAIRKTRKYIANACTCGYLPPPPTQRAVRFLNGLSRVLLWIQVGKVKYIGLENLNIPGPVIIAPNHPHYIDPAIIVRALNVRTAIAGSINQPARYMAARGVMRFGFGLVSLIAGRCGAFAVDLSPGKGGPAFKAGIKVVTSGQTLVIFPEGWAYMDGEMGTFKKGAVRIATAASRRLGNPVYIIPVHLRYGRYPGSWIRKLTPPLEYLFVFLNSWRYRRGATAVFGKPISSAELPEDAAAATELLVHRVQELDPALGKQQST